MPGIDVISVPYHAGAARERVGKGPDALLAAGIIDKLEETGAETHVIELGAAENVEGEIGKSFAAIRQVSEQVARTVGEGRFPLVLAGNCNISVGVYSGFGDPELGVVWFDAHPDFDTPDEHCSGYFDGMGVATLAGQCWRNLATDIPGFTPMPLDRLVYCGIRDFEPGQREKVEASDAAAVWGSEAMQGQYDEALTEALARAQRERVLIHLDLDCLDTSVGHANEYAAPGGLIERDLQDCMAAILEAASPVAMTIASFDPDLEGSERIAQCGVAAARQVANAVAAERISQSA